MIWLILIAALFLVVGVVCSKSNILSPSVITSAVWLFCLLLFVVLPHSLPWPSWQFLGALAIWIVGMSVSSLTMQSVSYKPYLEEADVTVRTIYLAISLLTVPGLIMYAQHALESASTMGWANALRQSAIGRSDDGEIYGGLQVIIWQVSYMLELYYADKSSRWRVVVAGVILLSFAFLTMSKWGFLSFFLTTITILYFKKKISLRHILIGLSVLFVLFVLIQAARFATDYDGIDKNNFTVLYLLSSITAFDTLEPCSSAHWGENVFRAIYAVGNKLGLTATEPPSSLLPFISQPIETNTYTTMYPFFKDFGYLGVGIFAVLMGAIYGFLFKKAQQGGAFYVLLYSLCVNILVIQFANEMLMTSLLAYIKQWLFLLLPFLATKFNVFKHTKSLVSIDE
ncbi:MAG: O-antigen polymerase [Bacteroidales bacterium]|nr:O-antigen polymerase [Bacteroidales bacterium]